MSNQYEEKLQKLSRELSWGDDEETEVLAEQSLSELRAFRAPGVALSPQKTDASKQRKPTKPGESSLAFDSEAWVANAPISEATRDKKHQTPATVEVDLGAEQLAELRAQRRAQLEQSNAGRDSTRRKTPSASAAKKRVTKKSRRARRNYGDLRPEGVEAHRKWSLRDTPLRAVLLSLAGAGEPTVLDLKTGKNRAQLLISCGELLEVRLLPCSVKRSLSAGLVKKGRLNPAEALSVRQYAQEQGISEASALLKAGHLLPAATVRSAARARRRYLLKRLMRANLAEASAYRLEAVPEGHRVAPIALVGILFRQIRAHYDAAPKQARVHAERRFAGMQIARKANFAFSINHLGLPLHERQLIDRVLTRERSYERVLHNSPLAEQATVAILVALEAVGLLQIKAPGLSSHGSSSWADDIILVAARIDAMELRLENENYFDLFGVHWSTYDTEVERAHRALGEHFGLLKQPLGLNSTQRGRLEAIRGELDKVYAILSDPTRRAEYRKTLISPANARRAARLLDGLGAAAFRKNAFHSALDYYQRVLVLEPNNAKVARLLPVLLARTTARRS